MSRLFTTMFWLHAFERAVKTVAQTAVALIGAEAFDVLSFDWKALAATSAGAGIVSILTSVASIQITGNINDPSLLRKQEGDPSV